MDQVDVRHAAHKKKLALIKDTIAGLEQKGISQGEILSYLGSSLHPSHVVRATQEDAPQGFPVHILAHKELSSLEAIVKYMREVLGLTNAAIARILGRDPRTTWQTYNQAKAKLRTPFKPAKSAAMPAALPGASGIIIPFSVISSRRLSVLESIVCHLLAHHRMRYCEIARLIGLDARTVWTAANRASMKQDRGKSAIKGGAHG